MSELLKKSIIDVGEKAISVIGKYFSDEEEDLEKVDRAFKMISNSTRILHMDQVRINSERGHALRLLKFLPDDETRNEYIKITNPKVCGLLEGRPNMEKNKVK